MAGRRFEVAPVRGSRDIVQVTPLISSDGLAGEDSGMPPLQEHIIAALAVELAELETVEQTIDQVVAFAAQTLQTPHAGVTLIADKGRGFDTAGPTSEAVREVDELQNSLREGPCIDAATEARSVVSNDLDQDRRWPNWGPQAAALGFGSILSSELHAGDRRIGALNVYADSGREFTQDDVETAQLLAYHASAALRFTDRLQGLTIALDNRTVIGQAQGILMERHNIDADRAFAVLKRYSQDQNVRLNEIAKQLVKRRS